MQHNGCHVIAVITLHGDKPGADKHVLPPTGELLATLNNGFDGLVHGSSPNSSEDDVLVLLNGGCQQAGDTLHV